MRTQETHRQVDIVKHWRTKAIGFVVALFLPAVSVLTQQETASRGNPSLESSARGYVNDGPVHRLMITSQDISVYNELSSRGAIIDEIDYGSFKMIRVSDQAAGGRDAITALSAVVRDDQDLISFNGFVIDGTRPELLSDQLPEDLRQTDMAQAVANGTEPRGGLYVVQFVGPIKDSWLSALKETGAEVITYAASNAYVVRASATAARALPGLRSTNAFVQFVGDYEPAFRISPRLRAAQAAATGAALDLTVQVLAGRGDRRTIRQLEQIAGSDVYVYDVLNYHNVQLRVPASRLAEIARLDNVFAIEERGIKRRLDEAQGQIVAGNLSGNVPTGPGYLAFLASKGFNSAQFGSFVVEVADDAYTLTGASGHPDLPSSRVAFENNPTSQAGAQGGHGFLNTHIVGGFNNGTGSVFEDAGGFNYGLGIAPFARMGITAIFGPGAFSPTSWESAAYGGGARVSSNSWGFITDTGELITVYDSNAQEYDALVRDAQAAAGLQQLTVVFAAGNSGSGANTVSTPATAKNIITVGASENVRASGTDGCGITDAEADNASDVIFFSSRGPVNSSGGDGRIKPDIMAPGTHIEAGIPQSDYDGSSVCDMFSPVDSTLYGLSSGTSHSCPAVAGGAALVYQDFLNKGLPAPSPAMVKAYLLNSATRMTGAGANDTLPSNNQGMGRMDLGRAFDGASRMLIDQTQVFGATGQTFQLNSSVVNPGLPLRVTLVWSDAPGPTTGAPYVNNLDLEVTVGGTTFKGNVFSGGASVAGGTADPRNNSESVFLGASGSFTVTVRATNIAGDGVPGNADGTDQDFALVVYNGAAVCPPSISPSSQVFTPAAGSGSVTVTAAAGCAWSAVSNDAFITITSGSSGSGNGSVNYSVAAYPGPGSRKGTMTIAGKTFTVFQIATGADTDSDGIPDQVELPEGRDPFVKDNDVFNNARLFVMQQYRDFLGREGDAGGITFWTNQITSASQTRGQVINSFFTSAEFQNSTAPVTRLYFAYFLRIPDYSGLIFWVNIFKSGVPLSAISDAFAQSAEFQNRYGSLDDTQFVTLLYNNVLERAPDAGGLAFWVGQLDSGAMTRGQVMLGFSESAEFKTKSLNKVFVVQIYVGMLRRSPDQGGFNFWVGALDGGASGLNLIQGFLSSTEYRNRFLPSV